ncbi:MAG: adenine-specific methyltransferase EcoRI family protein [bacterium]
MTMSINRNPQTASPSPPSGNRTLNSAKRAKQDEFYTQLGDISNELKYYKAKLCGKTIFCNCDDPFESNFFKYFALNFNTLGLKKLIATSYKKSPIVGAQLPLFEIEGLKPEGKEPYAIEINEVPDQNGDGATDITDVEYLLKHNANTALSLKGDNIYSGGDFRSRECMEFLNQADIVITNPPFSLFHEYVAQLDVHNKQFLIIGNKNAITYKEIFKLIKENKVWIGVTPMGTDMLFDVPEEYAKTMISSGKEGSSYKIINGIVKGRSPSIWFTNMDNPKRHEKITLYKKYSPVEYPKYDNYDAIEVGKVADIPLDYDGVMGVPVSFLDKYSPEQFKILGASDNGAVDEKYKLPHFKKHNEPYINGKKRYKRLFIKRKI